jgi:hypothetical protein
MIKSDKLNNYMYNINKKINIYSKNITSSNIHSLNYIKYSGDLTKEPEDNELITKFYFNKIFNNTYQTHDLKLTMNKDTGTTINGIYYKDLKNSVIYNFGRVRFICLPEYYVHPVELNPSYSNLHIYYIIELPKDNNPGIRTSIITNSTFFYDIFDNYINTGGGFGYMRINGSIYINYVGGNQLFNSEFYNSPTKNIKYKNENITKNIFNDIECPCIIPQVKIASSDISTDLNINDLKFNYSLNNKIINFYLKPFIINKNNIIKSDYYITFQLPDNIKPKNEFYEIVKYNQIATNNNVELKNALCLFSLSGIITIKTIENNNFSSTYKLNFLYGIRSLFDLS